MPTANFFKDSAEFAFSPVGIMTILLAGGIILTIFVRSSHWGRRFLLIGAFLFFLFTISPLAEVLIRNLEIHYPPLLTPPTSISAKRIVILSGYSEEHPTIPVTSTIYGETLYRLAEGMRLYRRMPGSNLIMSGGPLGIQGRSVAGIMADFVREMGIPDKDILVERKSRNTYENLAEVKKIIGTDRFVLVTSAFALPRAMAVAGKLGMNPIAAPAHIWALEHYPPKMNWIDWPQAVLDGLSSPSPVRLAYIQFAYHEYLGYAWYKILGRI